MRLYFGVNIDRHIAHPRHAFRSSHQRLAKARNLAFGRVTKLYIKRHIATGDADIFDGFGRDKIASGIGIHNEL